MTPSDKLPNRLRSPANLLMAAGLMLALVGGTAADAQAQKRVQRPGKHALTEDRTAAADAARKRTVSRPRARAEAAGLLAKAMALGPTAFADSGFRQALVDAPMMSRLEMFVGLAKAQGIKVTTFQRTIKGLKFSGKQGAPAEVTKTFFHVTSETFGLIPQAMGENVVWFAGNESPGHLHTLVADQNGMGRFTHNTYGKTLGTATVATNTQYAAPVALTGPEMDRFVSYLNAGVKENAKPMPDRKGVYGFTTSAGQLICNTRCTNWATTAPIGDLEPWAAKVDSDIAAAAAAGHLTRGFAGGLYGRLAKASNPAARAKLLVALEGNVNLSEETKEGVRKLVAAFDFSQLHFPARPRDLVARKSLAEVAGTSRAQDPAKFLYDLFMSDRVPVIAIISPAPLAKVRARPLDLETMGIIGADGHVQGGLGAIVPAAPAADATPNATATATPAAAATTSTPTSTTTPGSAPQ